MEVFGRDGLVVFSNSAGSGDDAGYEEAHKIERTLGLPVLRHAHKKPLGFDSVMQHFAALSPSSSSGGGGATPVSGPVVTAPSQLAMVGDRYFTDVLFGNLHGMLTVHTSLLTSSGDPAVVKAVRTSSLLGASHIACRSHMHVVQPHTTNTQIRGWEENYVLRLMKQGVRPPAHPLYDESIVHGSPMSVPRHP
jgi:hypothetical protein